MRTLLIALALAACAGDSPEDPGGRMCAGNLYDLCHDEHDCLAASPVCRTFAAGFQVCTLGCTVGDDATCASTSDGKPATCAAPGICTPPAANPCVAR
jgi:hypothetical protein